jgi:hypothetical protein
MNADRTAPRLAALVLASLVTLAVLAGLDTLAVHDAGHAVLARAAASQPA